ncbi:hypothetical protein Tco_0432759 [Tanacetum coccineum]
MVYVVNGVLASGVDMLLEKDLVGFALQEMKIHPLMLLILSMIFQTFSPTFHNPSTRHTRASYVEMILTMVMIVHQENLNQQKMYELLQMMHSFCEKLLQQKQAASIDQSPLQEMSIQDMEDLKQHYLDEMLSLNNDLQIKDYRNEKIDIHFRRECESMIDELKGKFNEMSIEINKKKELQHLEHVANLSTYPSQRFKSFCYDDNDDYAYEESTIPLNETDSQTPPSIAITPILPTLEPEDSLIMGNVELSIIPEKESNKVYEEISVTFSNPLFDSNDDFTSSDDESLSDEDVLEENNIESKDSYVSNLDEPDLLVTPLSDFNEDECFDPGGDVDEIEFLLHRDPSTPKMSVVSILEGFTDEPPFKKNDDLFDLESKENEWKKILYDASIDDLMTKDKDCLDYEDSRARGFVHRSLNLQSLA